MSYEFEGTSKARFMASLQVGKLSRYFLAWIK